MLQPIESPPASWQPRWRLHDARPTAGDDGEAFASEQPGQLPSLGVVGVALGHSAEPKIVTALPTAARASNLPRTRTGCAASATGRSRGRPADGAARAAARPRFGRARSHRLRLGAIGHASAAATFAIPVAVVGAVVLAYGAWLGPQSPKAPRPARRGQFLLARRPRPCPSCSANGDLSLLTVTGRDATMATPPVSATLAEALPGYLGAIEKSAATTRAPTNHTPTNTSA